MPVPTRTPAQHTLLGTGAGSRIAWTLWSQGYQQGVESGHAAGYREAMADLLGMAELVAEQRPSSGPSRDELMARRAPRADLDTRSGAELVAAARASWAEPGTAGAA